MAELGSIFEPETPGGVRGADLRVRVTCPTWALGDPDGVLLEVPSTIEVDGVAIPRVRSPFDEGDRIRVTLPESFPDGGTLRLRGQGGAPAGDGRPGDLLVTIALDVDAPRPLTLPSSASRPSNLGLLWALVLGVLGLFAYLAR